LTAGRAQWPRAGGRCHWWVPEFWRLINISPSLLPHTIIGTASKQSYPDLISSCWSQRPFGDAWCWALHPAHVAVLYLTSLGCAARCLGHSNEPVEHLRFALYRRVCWILSPMQFGVLTYSFFVALAYLWLGGGVGLRCPVGWSISLACRDQHAVAGAASVFLPTLPLWRMHVTLSCLRTIGALVLCQINESEDWRHMCTSVWWSASLYGKEAERSDW